MNEYTLNYCVEHGNEIHTSQHGVVSLDDEPSNIWIQRLVDRIGPNTIVFLTIHTTDIF